jgi:hypothetical protein
MNDIQNRIYTIRGIQVMLDRDLAELYGVETKHINQAVKNNLDKFPSDFMFELSKDEFTDLRSKILPADFSKVRITPKVFSEQGVYMLATIIKGKIATQTTISIMRTFTKMKHFIYQNSHLFARFERIEYKLNLHDNNFERVFKALEDKSERPTQGIFFDGQIFDAYVFVGELLQSASSKIILIDNYIDTSVLILFSRYSHIKFEIITKNISKQLKLDIQKYNSQYGNLTVKTSNKFHDRFLIIDDKEAYHIGASLKDLGKKIFAFSKININLLNKELEQ